MSPVFSLLIVIGYSLLFFKWYVLSQRLYLSKFIAPLFSLFIFSSIFEVYFHFLTRMGIWLSRNRDFRNKAKELAFHCYHFIYLCFKLTSGERLHRLAGQLTSLRGYSNMKFNFGNTLRIIIFVLKVPLLLLSFFVIEMIEFFHI